MPETTPNTAANATQGAPAEPERKFTQAEMDSIIGERLKRAKEKYADYDELKAKAAKYDEEAGKSELQKAIDRAEKAEGKLKALESERKLAELRAEVAKDKGIEPGLLRGTTREELEAHADAINAYMGTSKRYPSVPDYGETKASAGKSTAQQYADAIDFL